MDNRKEKMIFILFPSNQSNSTDLRSNILLLLIITVEYNIKDNLPQSQLC